MTTKITNPFAYVAGLDGLALDAGKIYIGEPDLDPITNPKTAYFDEDLTIPAAQPVRTSSGYPVNGVSAAALYLTGNYSIAVYTSEDELIFSSSIEGEVAVEYSPLELTLGAYPGVRPEDFGGRDAASVRACFDAVGAAGGGVIFLDAEVYESPYSPPVGDGYFDEPPLMTHDNITIVGRRLPRVNDETNPTALVDGSIIAGSFFFAANNFNWENIGIDVGVDWCAANNAGEAKEGLISINRHNAGFAGFGTIADEPPRIGGKDRGDIVILCQGTGRPAAYWDAGDLGDVSDIHAALLENDDGAICHGVFRTILGGAGWVLKSSNCEYSAVKVERCFKYGQGLLKSEDYSAANDNRVHFLRSINHEYAAPDTSLLSNYHQNAGRLEAATADCTGNVISTDGTFGLINGWEFYALATYACEGNTLHCLGPLDECFSYSILGNGPGTSENTVYSMRSANPLIGAYALAGHSIRMIDAEVKGARQYSYRANATASLELLNPRSEGPAFGHILNDGAVDVIGTFQALGAAPISAGTGVVTGVTDSALFLAPGDNVVVDGDCESIDGWDDVSGSTTLAVVSGGQVGNALEITRVSASAGYVRQQLVVETGKKYKVSLYFKNGTTSLRLFLSNISFADGVYTGGTFVALSNASWTLYEASFTALSEVLFITVQVPGAVGTTCLIDEVEIEALPLTVDGDVSIGGGISAVIPTYADNAAAISGGLSAGDFYTDGGDPAPLRIVT